MIFSHLAGFSPGQVFTDLIVALVLGFMAFGKRYYKRELIDPVRELKQDFRIEKKKRKRFEIKIVSRMDAYEKLASEERHLQVVERSRVNPE